MPKFVSNTWLRQEAERLELVHLRAVRDELVAALERLVNAQNNGPEDHVEREMANARAAIAKAKEQP
jgi:hypothetical protein